MTLYLSKYKKRVGMSFAFIFPFLNKKGGKGVELQELEGN